MIGASPEPSGAGRSAEGARGYAAIHRDFIDPIERSQALALRFTTAIANEFGAHG